MEVFTSGEYHETSSKGLYGIHGDVSTGESTGTYNSSNSTNTSSTFFVFTEDPPTDWAVTTGVVMGVVTAIMGFIGNAITIAAYRRNRKLRTSFNFLITNLCVLDFVFSTIVLPAHLPMLFRKSKAFNGVWCSAVGYLYYIFLSSSVINIVCIAINRYVGIVHSRRYRLMFSHELAKWWIVGIWASSPLLYLPLLIVRSIRWQPSTLRCALYSSDLEMTSIRCYQIALNIFLQVIPTIAITVLYRGILRKVQKCRKTVEHYPITNSPSNATSYKPGSADNGLTPSQNHISNADLSAADNASNENSPKERRHKHSRPFASCRLVLNDDENDVSEGKKAIIMAYLQVPPATISPRRNPNLLYKRSPPQTRTMLIPEDGKEQNKVFISGTNSSPNLTKCINEPVKSRTSSGRCSPARWGKQRSFSTGDEEIEPESGMIGDQESDLPPMKMLSLDPGTYRHSFGSTLTPEPRDVCRGIPCVSINDDGFENSSVSTERAASVICKLQPSSDDEKDTNDNQEVSESRRRRFKIIKSFSSDCGNQTMKEVTDKKCSKSVSLPESIQKDLKRQRRVPVSSPIFMSSISDEKDPLPISFVCGKSDGIPTQERLLRSSAGSMKKLRLLKRQNVVEEDPDSFALSNNCDKDVKKELSKNKLGSELEIDFIRPMRKGEEVKLTRSCRSLHTSSWIGGTRYNSYNMSLVTPVVRSAVSGPINYTFSSVEKTDKTKDGLEAPSCENQNSEAMKEDEKVVLMNKSSKRARYVIKAASSSSDKCYTSQATESTYINGENTSRAEVMMPIVSNKKEVQFPAPEATPELDVKETDISKRILFRRGASDIGTVKWFRRFRKSRNWSLSSMKHSKYRVRGAAGMRKDTVIKIIIDHVTEEMIESSHEIDEVCEKQDAIFPAQVQPILSTGPKAVSECPPNQSEDTAKCDCNTSRKKFTVFNRTSNKENKTNCCRCLWEKFNISRKRSQTISRPETSPSSQGSCYCSNPGDYSWKGKGCEDEVGSDNSYESHQDSTQKYPPAMLSKWSMGTTSQISMRPMIMLPIPQLSMQNDDASDPVLSDGRESPEKLPTDVKPTKIDCETRRSNYAYAVQKGRQKLSDDDSTSRRESHDTDLIYSRENEDLLAKRREMNSSCQFLRVNNIAANAGTLQGEYISGCAIESVDLGRRWSGQSDAISLYSGKYPMSSNHALGGSVSALSKMSQILSPYRSKKSVGSSESERHPHHGRRRSIYHRWVAKKSIASSLGSSSSHRRRRDTERRLAYSGMAICIAFALCILPTSAVEMLCSVTKIIVPAEVKLGIAIISWFHVVINPLLYGFLNPQYRAEYKKMLKEAWDCLRCKRVNRTGFGHGGARSAIVKSMRQQYAGKPRRTRRKPCKCMRSSSFE